MEMKPKLNIIYRSYGIADRFDDGTIELNKHLEDYPALKRSIILHEVRHTNNPKLNKKDFIHDISMGEQIKTWYMIKFMFRHPLSLLQFLPFYYTKRRGWIIDKNLIIIYLFFGIISALGIYFGLVL